MEERLRELERDASSGNVEAEAKLLLERVRAKQMGEIQLRTAALLGHEASILALDKADRAQPLDVVHGLSGDHQRAFTLRFRTGVAMARALLPTWERHVDDRGAARKAVQAAEDWVTAEGDPEEAWAAFREASDELANLELPEPELDATYQCGRTLGGAQASPADLLEIWTIIEGLFHPDDPHDQGIDLEHLEPDEVGVKLLASAVESELIPWVLAYRDPVRDRVDARKRDRGE